jgi:4-diphosphocytidyl-2-C-methyl-D-erythritol kinase
MLTLKAPAKVNWFLKICGLRNDGYHDIKTLMQKISLYDVFSFSLSDTLEVTSDLQLPAKQNLVYKAARLLKQKYSVDAGAAIHLAKNIPIAAGLGGGSSDAACTLIGLNTLWSLKRDIKDLAVCAEQLGSDIPFFLYDNLSYVEGKGEKLTPCKADNPFPIVLVKPHISVSTKWAYENFKKNTVQSPTFRDAHGHNINSDFHEKLTKNIDTLDNIRYFFQAIRSAKIYKNTEYFNDLESVTIKNFPVIGDIKRRLCKEGALFTLMSGSGPTVFGVFNTHEDAVSASKSFKEFWTAVLQTETDDERVNRKNN